LLVLHARFKCDLLLFGCVPVDDLLDVLVVLDWVGLKIDFCFLLAGVVGGGRAGKSWLSVCLEQGWTFFEVVGRASANRSYSGSGSGSGFFLFCGCFFFGDSSSLSESDKTYSSSPISVWYCNLGVVDSF
jgi:hypothetical protein